MQTSTHVQQTSKNIKWTNFYTDSKNGQMK